MAQELNLTEVLDTALGTGQDAGKVKIEKNIYFLSVDSLKKLLNLNFLNNWVNQISETENFTDFP